MKTNFENIGGSYSQQGDYLLPTLTLPDENQKLVGHQKKQSKCH